MFIAYIVCNCCVLRHHDLDNALAFVVGLATALCDSGREVVETELNSCPAEPFTALLVTKPSNSHHRRPVSSLALPYTSSSRPRACNHSFPHALPHALPRPSLLLSSLFEL